MARATADLVGLAHKGRLEVGADADLILYDPARPQTLRADRFAHRHPLSAYDGLALQGAVVDAVLRGKILASDEDASPRGRFLRGPGATARGAEQAGAGA